MLYRQSCEHYQENFDFGPGMLRVLVLLVTLLLRSSAEANLNLNEDSGSDVTAQVVERFIRPPYVFVLQLFRQIAQEAETFWSDFNSVARRNVAIFLFTVRFQVLELLRKLAQQSLRDAMSSSHDTLLMKQQLVGALCLRSWITCDILHGYHSSWSTSHSDHQCVGICFQLLCEPENRIILEWICSCISRQKHTCSGTESLVDPTSSSSNGIDCSSDLGKRLFNAMSSSLIDLLASSNCFQNTSQANMDLSYSMCLGKVAYCVYQLHTNAMQRLERYLKTAICFYGEDEGYGQCSVEGVRVSCILSSTICQNHFAALIQVSAHGQEYNYLDEQIINASLCSLEKPLDFGSIESALDFVAVLPDILPMKLRVCSAKLNTAAVFLNYSLNVFRLVVISLLKCLQQVMGYCELMDVGEEVRFRHLQIQIADAMILLTNSWPKPMNDFNVHFDYHYLALAMLNDTLNDAENSKHWTSSSAVLILISAVVEAVDVCLGDDDDDEEQIQEELEMDVAGSFNSRQQLADFDELMKAIGSSAPFSVDILGQAVVMDGKCPTFPSMWKNVIGSLFSAARVNVHWGVRKTGCKVVGEICQSVLSIREKNKTLTLQLVNASISFLLSSLQVYSGRTCEYAAEALRLISISLCRKRNREVTMEINNMIFTIIRIRGDGVILNQGEAVNVTGIDGIFQIACSEIVNRVLSKIPTARIHLYEALSRVSTYCCLSCLAGKDHIHRGVVFKEALGRVLSPILAKLNLAAEAHNQNVSDFDIICRNVAYEADVITKIFYATNECVTRYTEIKQEFLLASQAVLGVVVERCSPLIFITGEEHVHFDARTQLAESLCRLLTQVVGRLEDEATVFTPDVVELATRIYMLLKIPMSLDCISSCIYSDSLKAQHVGVVVAALQKVTEIHFSIDQSNSSQGQVILLPAMLEPETVKFYFALLRDTTTMKCEIFMHPLLNNNMNITMLEAILMGSTELLWIRSTHRDATRSVCSFLKLLFKIGSNELTSQNAESVLNVYKISLVQAIFGLLLETHACAPYISDLLYELSRDDQDYAKYRRILIGEELADEPKMSEEKFLGRIFGSETAVRFSQVLTGLDINVRSSLYYRLLKKRRRKAKFKAELNEFKLLLEGHIDSRIYCNLTVQEKLPFTQTDVEEFVDIMT
uniref:Uncharacterized protein n=1 Tax=Aplanochytrium stocchinoi TaxID=215587 RepID=A0A7S3LIH1_9STRA